ncbi:MAG: serine protease [Erysipelotrichaceae bacterium]|nr:serine protease [Erysipelotrichaceae bacterium]MBQ4019468.1 serine protease [Erysipelotrichaceae bacterium]
MKNNRLLYVLIILLTLWCAVLSSEISRARQRESANVVNQYEVDGFSTDLTKVIDEVRPGIVTISADNNILSGFVYRQSGEDVYILTAYHGVANVSSINVRFGVSYNVEGELIGHDIYSDLALIRINTPYLIEPLKCADVSLLKQGEFMVSLGTPVSLELEGSSELCIISKTASQIENTILVDNERYTYYLNVIQLGTVLPQGYSGSPIINMNGEVVGINTMAYQGGVTFAITANEARIIADELIGQGFVDRQFFGVKGIFLKDMYNYERTNLNIGLETTDGLYVERVREESVAFAAGIRQGDVITRIGNEAIVDLNSYLRALYSTEEAPVFEYVRAGERLTGSVAAND